MSNKPLYQRLPEWALGPIEFVLPLSWARKWRWLPPPEASAWYPKKQESRGLALQSGTRWILSVGSFILAAWVSALAPSDLVPATSCFWHALPTFWRLDAGEANRNAQEACGYVEAGVHGPIRDVPKEGLPLDLDKSTLSFWVLAVVWIRALFIRLRDEDQAEARYREDLMGALYGMPNLDVLWHYATRFFGKTADLTLVELPKGRAALAEQIQLVLAVLAEMAKEFARDHDGAYGASLMLVVSQEDIPRLPPEWRTAYRPEAHPVQDGNPHGRLRFAGYRTDVFQQSGLLVLPDDLALKSIPGDNLPQKTYPLISLPIRYEPVDSILPGAPRAVLDGYSVHNDTRMLADEDCQGLAPATRQEVHDYFAPGGDGEAVRSMAAIRIGKDGRDPLGVVSIDTDTVGVLGLDEAYHRTFISLVQPLLRLLDPLVRQYADEWWAEVDAEPKVAEVPASSNIENPEAVQSSPRDGDAS